MPCPAFAAASRAAWIACVSTVMPSPLAPKSFARNTCGLAAQAALLNSRHDTNQRYRLETRDTGFIVRFCGSAQPYREARKEAAADDPYPAGRTGYRTAPRAAGNPAGLRRKAN